MSIKTLIIGCGAVIHEIYRKPLIRLQKQRDLTIIGLVDPNQAHTEALKTIFRTQAVCDNVDDAVAKCGVELAIISSPPFLHAEHTVAALKQGMHVLCEKPMAPTVSECNLMIEEAKSRERILAIGMTRRFYPSLNYLRNWIAMGRMQGEITFSYREGGQYQWPIKTAAGFKRGNGGSGLLMDVGSHVLDTIRWLLGPLSVEAYVDDALVGGVESNCIIDVQAPKAKGRVQLSWNQPLANRFHVTDGKTEIVVNPLDMHHVTILEAGIKQYLTLDIGFPVSSQSMNVELEMPKTYLECCYYQIVQILRAIRFGENLPVTGEQSMEVIAAMDACYQIAAPMTIDWLAQLRCEASHRLHWRHSA